MFHIADVLKKDKNLVQLEGRDQFQLKFPYGFGAVFARLHQKDFIENGLYAVVEPSFCLTRDEIDPEKDGFSEENFNEYVYDSVPVAKASVKGRNGCNVSLVSRSADLSS